MKQEQKKPESSLALRPAYEMASYHQIEMLTVEMAKADLWPQAPLEEVKKAVHIAKARGANPWCDEIYLIPRRTKKPNGSWETRWVIQMSQNYVLKVATSHPACAGWKDGVIVQRQDGTLIDLDGTVIPQGYSLIGSWFVGYRHGWKVPITKRVQLEDYDTGKSIWKTLKSTMIVKVARTQGLREMLPDRLSGMYDAAEMDQMGQAQPQDLRGELDDALAQQGIAPLPSAEPSQTQQQQGQGEPAQESQEEIDNRHLWELVAILRKLTDSDKDKVKGLLIEFSEFKGSDGTMKCIDSLKDPDDPEGKRRHPQLTSKWINTMIGKARSAYAKWLEAHPEEHEQIEMEAQTAEGISPEEQQAMDGMQGAAP